MTLQSPARLNNSHNSSTNTLKQQAQQMMGTPDEQTAQKEPNSGILEQISNSSPTQQKVGKKIFMFNSSASKEPSFVDARNRSPCFGSVKGSQHILPTDRQNSIENLGSFAEHGSQSMSSLRQKSNKSGSSKHTPFPQPQNQLAALSRRSEQSLTDVIKNQISNDGGVGGTKETRDFDSTTSQQATEMQTTKHGMGTGYQTSTTNDAKRSKKLRVNNATNKVTNRRVPLISVSSPPPKNQINKRRSIDISNGGVVNTESDYAAQSSHHDLLSE